MKYYIDGFTKIKNPSPIGGGYSIFDENNTLIKVENIEKIGMTNNEAELLGLYNCLKEVSIGDTISTDSMNTIAWIRTNKTNKIARKDLIPIILECRQMLESCKINLIWEGREFNLAGIYNESSGIDTAMIKDVNIEIKKSLLLKIKHYIIENEKFLNEMYDDTKEMPSIFYEIDKLLN